jgi:hypothetical protein
MACQTLFDSALTDEVPRLVMEHRAGMAWVHEPGPNLRDSLDMEYLAQIIDSLYIFLPAVRDLRKAALLEEERCLQDAGLPYGSNGCVISHPCATLVNDEKIQIGTTASASVPLAKPVPALAADTTPSDLGISQLIYSLLDQAANFWKQSRYHAEEFQGAQISVPMFSISRVSMSRISQRKYTQTKAKPQPPQFHVDQKTHQPSQISNVSSGKRSNSVGMSHVCMTPGKCGCSELALREDIKRRNATLGAGAAGLVLARVLLTRRARFRIRV